MVYIIPKNYIFQLAGSFQNTELITKELELIAVKYQMSLTHKDLGTDDAKPEVTLYYD